MLLTLGWNWPRDVSLHYCFKVSIASLLGYQLLFDGDWYAIYGAFSAADRRHEPRRRCRQRRQPGARQPRGHAGRRRVLAGRRHARSRSRARHRHHRLYVHGMGLGRGAARVGATVCAVTALAHADNALGYTAMRLVTTLIGIGAGLLVSYLVLPVRGRDAMERSMKRALETIADLLARLARADQAPEDAQYRAVLDSPDRARKGLRCARDRGEAEDTAPTIRSLGSLAWAPSPRHWPIWNCAAAPVRSSVPWRCASRRERSHIAPEWQPEARRRAPWCSPALQRRAGRRRSGLESRRGRFKGFALGLRKVDHALTALGPLKDKPAVTETVSRRLAPARVLLRRQHHREVAEHRVQHAGDRVADREADPRHAAADLLRGLARRPGVRARARDAAHQHGRVDLEEV